jgi:hypothetical protein
MSRLLVLLLFAFPLFASDTTIGWISRSPELEYVWGSANPAVDGWPLAGSTVTWRAHIRNYGTSPVNALPYVWRVDGVQVAAGAVNVAANGVTVVELQRLWTADRERIQVTVGEHELETFSDALSVGFWVEQSFHDQFRARQHELGIGSTGFEDWAQRTISLFNDMAAMAGVIDRLRLQKIVVVPDRALPLNGLPADASLGANGATHPDQNDRTVDLMWGFRATELNGYLRGSKSDPLNWFYTGVGALHELGHARYLVDVYAWDVRHLPPHFRIDVPGVVPVESGGLVHRTPEQGLMNKHYSFIDRYSARAMNRIAGRRAVAGNYNEPRNFGEFLNDMPAENSVTIRDEQGVAIPNAGVEIYRATRTSPTPLWYGAHFDSTPDLVLRTDDRGRVLVGRSPFGTVVHAPDLNTGVVIVRVGEKIGYLESRLFNLAYWNGETEFADHELLVGRECGSEGTRLRGPEWDAATSGPVRLEWDPMVDATHYRVYADNRLIGSTTGTSIDVRLNGRVYWWVESDLGICGTRRSYPGRFFASNDTVLRRRAAR